MSTVTDVILTYFLSDQDKLEAVNQLIVAAYDGDDLQSLKLVSDDFTSGGTKAMQCEVAVGAFNYFDTHRFAAELAALPWRNPERVKLFAQEEHDDFGVHPVEIPWMEGKR